MVLFSPDGNVDLATLGFGCGGGLRGLLLRDRKKRAPQTNHGREKETVHRFALVARSFTL